MKVSDILRVKGGTLFTVVARTQPLAQAVDDDGRARHRLAGRDGPWRAGRACCTFREVIQAVGAATAARVGDTVVRTRDGRPPAHLHAGNRDRRGAPHDARPPCPLHAGDERSAR